MTLLNNHIPLLPAHGYVDRYARRELTEHIAALCAAVHGTRYGQRCQRCTGLTSSLRAVVIRPAPLWPAVLALTAVPCLASGAVIHLTLRSLT